MARRRRIPDTGSHALGAAPRRVGRALLRLLIYMLLTLTDRKSVV